MGADQIVDLIARDLPFEYSDHATVSDEHERRCARHAELLHHKRMPFGVDLEDGEVPLLRYLHPGDQARHPAGRSRAVLADEEERGAA